MIEPQAGVTRLEGACDSGWFKRRYRPSICLWVGLAGGVLIAVFSQGVGLLPTGHQANDPILLSLSIGSLLRGFLYFNWPGFLLALGFPVVAGLLAWASLKLLAGRKGLLVHSADASRAARLMAALAMVPVWLQEVDALQVLLWYAISSWLTLVIAGFTARQASRL